MQGEGTGNRQRRRNGQQAEKKPVSWKEISHSSEELSDQLTHETEGRTVTGQWGGRHHTLARTA